MTLRARIAGSAALLALLLPACTGSPAAVRTTPTATAQPTATISPTPTPKPVAFDADLAMAHVRRLAVTIGPREAASPAYVRAARYVESVFERYGYEVRNQQVPVPSGTSQGVPVSGGFTSNVIAVPDGFDPTEPH